MKPLFLACGLLAAVIIDARADGLRQDERIVFYPTLGWRVSGGWNVEVSGAVYEPESRPVAVAAAPALLGIRMQELNEQEQATFRERVRLFLVDHQDDRTVTVRLHGQSFTLGPTAGDGIVRQTIFLKDHGRTPLPRILTYSTLDLPATQSATGTVHLLRDSGLSVISDVDDTIKISQVRDRGELLRNTFCRPFQPVPGIARVYQSWADSRSAAFHYVSASPWQLYPLLADFIRSRSFPPGTFHLRQFRLKDGSFLDLFQSPERYKRQTITPLLERYPHRRFVLVGDSGERDPEIYGALAREHRQQIVRILIRDVTGEPRESPRYQQAFDGLPANCWRLFREPASLTDALP